MNYVWTKLDYKIEIAPSRIVLVEKFFPKFELINFFNSRINDCDLYLNSFHENSLFFVRNNKILMQKDDNAKLFRVKHIGLGEYINKMYEYNVIDIDLFLEQLFRPILNSGKYSKFSWSRSEIADLEHSLQNHIN